MTKYLLKRLLHGLISVVIVVAIVMILIYSLMNRDQVIRLNDVYRKKQYNEQEVYKYELLEQYGYVDYVSYGEYLNSLHTSGEITEDEVKQARTIGKSATGANDSEIVKKYVEKFTSEFKSKGYTVVRKGPGGPKEKTAQILYAYKDIPVTTRLWRYFANLIEVDNIHYVEKTTGEALEDTGITFTWYDPVYNTDPANPDVLLKEKFSPAIIGNGTKHKYLLYFDDVFPYIHQNLITVNLGVSYTVNTGVDIIDTMTTRQDPARNVTVTYPTGLVEESSRNLHTATYVKTDVKLKNIIERFGDDDYTNVLNYKQSFSKVGFSFVIGIIAVFFSYLLGVPLGILMARKKNTWVDRLGMAYVIFIIAVPSLAYIFLFRSIGGKLGLPIAFLSTEPTKLMYVLPIVSLALPSVAGLMKWVRRYMIDQQNSDYVKFARSGGLSESEIFNKHILKNAIIPIVHGIPGSILGAVVGAIITESIYTVPGAGYLLTTAINQYDNSVIVGLTMFYAMLSIISLIAGDILMSVVDPRISFTEKAR